MEIYEIRGYLNAMARQALCLQRKVEVRSFNQCYNGKAMSIT